MIRDSAAVKQFNNHGKEGGGLRIKNWKIRGFIFVEISMNACIFQTCPMIVMFQN